MTHTLEKPTLHVADVSFCRGPLFGDGLGSQTTAVAIHMKSSQRCASGTVASSGRCWSPCSPLAGTGGLPWQSSSTLRTLLSTAPVWPTRRVSDFISCRGAESLFLRVSSCGHNAFRCWKYLACTPAHCCCFSWASNMGRCRAGMTLLWSETCWMQWRRRVQTSRTRGGDG